MHIKINKHFKISLFSLWAVLTIYLIINNFHRPKITVSNTRLIEAYFSPQDKPLKPLLNLINKTNKTLWVAVYTFTSKDLAEALIKAKNRGVDVQVITDPYSLKAKSGQVENLQKNKIPIFVFHPEKANRLFRPLMHNKFAIFDFGDSQKFLCTGSLNWTKSALNSNQENIIITDCPRAYEKYKIFFNKIREEATVA
ncbi:hypothetical protein KAW80_02870 [Candidatus Babeliales bacterium]|nr:hypothetical protein [Candidatus Babeliales bacterium]